MKCPACKAKGTFPRDAWDGPIPDGFCDCCKGGKFVPPHLAERLMSPGDCSRELHPHRCKWETGRRLLEAFRRSALYAALGGRPE